MSTVCSSCGSTARFARDDKLLCETCYQARVPSWSRLESDRLERPGEELAPPDDEPTRGSHRLQFYGFVINLLVTILFAVMAFRAALDAEWADMAVSGLIALLLVVLTRKQWRRWRVASGKSEDAD